MIVAIASDTHAGFRGAEKNLNTQSQKIKKLKPDVLLHLGDIAETAKTRLWFYKLYRDLHCPKIVIPGNHDFWIRNSRIDRNVYAIRDHHRTLRQDAIDRGWQWLSDNPVQVGSLMIVGRMMGFDGSSFPMNRTRDCMWNEWMSVADGDYTRYPGKDIIECTDPWSWYDKELENLVYDLENINIENVDDLIIATHYPCSDRLKHPYFGGNAGSFFFLNNSYELLKEKFLRGFVEAGVRVWILAGHTHGATTWVDPDKDLEGKVRCVVNGSTYCKPITQVLDLDEGTIEDVSWLRT